MKQHQFFIVRTYSLFHEACFPPKEVIACISKRRNRAIPTGHQGYTAGEAPLRRCQRPFVQNAHCDKYWHYELLLLLLLFLDLRNVARAFPLHGQSWGGGVTSR